MRCFAAIVGTLIFGINAADAETKPYRDILHPTCPTLNDKITWREYMSAKAPPVAAPTPQLPNRRLWSGDVSIQFREANKLNDTDALPNIDPSACYRVIYHPPRTAHKVIFRPGSYKSFRSYAYERKMDGPGPFQVMDGLPGDPEKFQINIAGTIYRFDEGGTVYNLRNKAAGVMVCIHANDCEKYRYASTANQPTKVTPYKGSWSDLAAQIVEAGAKGERAGSFRTIFLDQNVRFSSTLDPRLYVVAENLQFLVESYLESPSFDRLDEVFQQTGDAVSYAHDYGLALIPSYSVLASLWLALSFEEEKVYGKTGRVDDVKKALKKGLDDYWGNMYDQVVARHTDIERFPDGIWSWKRNSDGQRRIQASNIRTFESAYDVWMAEMSNLTEEGLEKNESYQALKELGTRWKLEKPWVCDPACHQ